MDESKKKRPLYIPTNTPDYDAIISGVGTMELLIFVSATLIAVLLGILLATIFNTLLAVMVGFTIIAFSILTFRRDIYNENLLMKLEILKKYLHNQKKYKYVYTNIYEVPIKDNTEEIEEE